VPYARAMMGFHEASMPGYYQEVVRRFIAACEMDTRIVAAFLAGSFAAGTADAYSDLDLGLIISDAAYDEFWHERQTFLRLLGEPIFLEDYSEQGIDLVFLFLGDGAEIELALGRESQFQHIHGGPHRVLLDKKDILAGVSFPLHQADRAAQVELLRSLITWFWHDLCHHFITPMARGQLWSAHGGQEDLRRACVNLARLRADFARGADGYEKVEQALPLAELAPLRATCCPLEPEALLQAALGAVHFYREVALPLAAAYGVPYPAALDRLLQDRLAGLQHGSALPRVGPDA
jgi:predicted nucleotidyltransferase